MTNENRPLDGANFGFDPNPVAVPSQADMDAAGRDLRVRLLGKPSLSRKLEALQMQKVPFEQVRLMRDENAHEQEAIILNVLRTGASIVLDDLDQQCLEIEEGLGADLAVSILKGRMSHRSRAFGLNHGVSIIDFVDSDAVEERHGLINAFLFFADIEGFEGINEYSLAYSPLFGDLTRSENVAKTDIKSEKIITAARKLKKQIAIFGEKTLDKALDGDEKFDELRGEIEKAMEDRRNRYVILTLLSGQGSEVELYRRLKSLEGVSQNSIIGVLTSNLERTLEAPFLSNVNFGDLASVDSEVGVNFVKQEFLGIRAFGRESTNVLDLELGENEIGAKKVVLRHTEKVPNTLSADISFKDLDGIFHEVRIVIDFKKGFLDWGFADAPELNKHEASLFLHLIKNAGQILVQEKEIRKEAEKIQGKTGDKGSGRKWSQQIEPERVLSAERRYQTQVQASQMGIEKETKSGMIVRHISEINEEELEKMLKDFSYVDRMKIRAGLSRFNETGQGTFKKHERNFEDGANAFALRINTTSPGGARVMVRESESIKGQMNFEIVDIVKRPDLE